MRCGLAKSGRLFTFCVFYHMGVKIEERANKRKEMASVRRSRCGVGEFWTGAFEAYYWTIAGCHASLRSLII